MLRWTRGKTPRLDHIRNVKRPGRITTRKEAHVKPVETFLENKRLKWCGHALLEARTQLHLCEIAQRPTEEEMKGQHTRRHEEIPTD